MNIILLSGGNGKRLWQLSNDIRSKHDDFVIAAGVQHTARAVLGRDLQKTSCEQLCYHGGA